MNQVDIQIHLLLRNSAQSTDNQFDISVEINSDGENVIETAAAEHEDNNFFTSDQVYTPRNSNHVEKEISSSSKTTLISTISTMMTCDPTPFAEVVGWGRNTSYIFDPSRDKLNPIATSNSTSASDISDYICYHPTKLSIPPSINLERVAMIACSHRHVIVLTHNGSLYTCGDNTEGALGLGDTFSRHKLTLLLWPIGKDVNNNSNASDEQVEVQQTLETPENLIDKQLKKGNSYKRIVYIAAGSSDIGSHSMAIDEEGTLYGWGTPSATGHGKIQPVLSPLPVKLPLVDESVVGEAQAIQTTLASDKIMKVKHVACGGGFTVAVLSTGQVASWGMWAHGRLGLGAPPEAQINRGAGARRRKEQKKVVRYQLKPKVIPRLNNAIKVCHILFLSHILVVGFLW